MTVTYLTERDVSALLNVDSDEVWRLIGVGDLPQPKLNCGRQRWLVRDVVRVLTKRKQGGYAGAGAARKGRLE